MAESPRSTQPEPGISSAGLPGGVTTWNTPPRLHRTGAGRRDRRRRDKMDWEFELLEGPYGGTSEGPAWDGQAVLYTHIPESRIMRYDPSSGAITEYRSGTNNTNGL